MANPKSAATLLTELSNEVLHNPVPREVPEPQSATLYKCKKKLHFFRFGISITYC